LYALSSAAKKRKKTLRRIENEDLIIDEYIEESINSDEIRAIIFCEGEFSTHIFPSIFIDMKAKEMKNALMKYCSDIIINQIEI